MDNLVQKNLFAVDAVNAQYGVSPMIGDSILRGDEPDITRGIVSTQTGFPVREDLEAEVKSLVPLETPVRDLLPRKMGGGKAHSWFQETSFGGGYGYTGTTSASGASTTVTVDTTAGLRAGDIVYFATSALTKTVASVDSATQFTLSSNSSNFASGETVYRLVTYPDGGAAQQIAFLETGAPDTQTPTFAVKSSTYKLLGILGTITGLAAMAGASFMDQVSHAKMITLQNLLLNEENILINGSSTDVKKPFGNGTTNYCFDGLVNYITAANGCPADHIQTSIGAITIAHLNAQLRRCWERGGQGQYIIISGADAVNFSRLCETQANLFVPYNPNDLVLGGKVAAMWHPVTGERVDIVASRHLSPGTIIFGSKYGPKMLPAAEVVVLPAVPVANPGEMVQGYWSQDIPAGTSAPMTYGYLVAVAETLCVYNVPVFAISTGVTAAA